ncbi:acyltransferase family protein [Algibacter miyuki]|uniref:Acyltransferase family protein n=1 Tax=Algibacter miyuki TaxID=1306933 RepID=A0ABV5GZ16_9FLAO|nr:heparan-alpha-glucosaminide N-acetyltransferase domain-containing protein [Algibacter miyuki]MDN3666928.1 heparan-alpha-glucosaminide N-acetyltransferase domain-containing protein [Algibacter miyuki]
MKRSDRLISLDVLRGLTILLMILVNTPGSWAYVYSPLRHAEWHGCTPTDLVFPFFLFIVGVSAWFSVKKYATKMSKPMFFKIGKRALIIFLLGLLLNLYPYFDFSNVRVMGVLQRIAIAYAFGTIICLSFERKKILVVLGLIVLGYWGLLYFGGGTDPYSLNENIVRKFDLFVFGENHIYKGFGIPFDPEGLLSAIPSIATVIIGYLVGQSISLEAHVLLKSKKLMTYGALLTSLGFVWGFVFPINKALWTSSYVFFTAGLATLFLALLIYVIDFKGYTKWVKPFIHFGTNPLFIFVFSGLYVKTISYLIKIPTQDGEISGYKYLYSKVFVPIAGDMNGSLLFALTHIVVFWFICFLLYKNRIFIKI